MKMFGLIAMAVGVTTCALVTATAQVQVQTYSGSGDYQAYCSSCHGTDARGDGSIAKSLKQRPADLTLLAKRNGGVFPDEKVFKTIKSGGHNDSDMPTWGDVFAKSTESAGVEASAKRIDTMVRYLQTLQAK